MHISKLIFSFFPFYALHWQAHTRIQFATFINFIPSVCRRAQYSVSMLSRFFFFFINETPGPGEILKLLCCIVICKKAISGQKKNKEKKTKEKKQYAGFCWFLYIQLTEIEVKCLTCAWKHCRTFFFFCLFDIFTKMNPEVPHRRSPFSAASVLWKSRWRFVTNTFFFFYRESNNQTQDFWEIGSPSWNLLLL